MYDPDRPNSSQRSSRHIKDDYQKEGRQYRLPSNGLITALIIGCVGGIITLAVSTIIVLTNASLFNQAASASSKGVEMSYQIAISFLGWQCFGTFVELLIAFIFGIITGKVVGKLWLGSITGAVGGAIVSIGIFFSQYIPGYPGVISASHTWATFFISLFFYALFGGLTSLGGTRLTIRKQPHPRSRVEE